MNKAIHGLIVVVFAISCLCLWGMLSIVGHLTARMSLPGFTQFCVGLKPLLYVLPILAAGYCGYVWCSKEGARRSWVGFFAGTMSALVLVTMPTILATWLPLIDVLARLPRTTP